MRLALAVGRPDVDGMLSEISSSQLTEWVEFFKLEPWGTEREDWRAGMLASTFANCNRGKNVKPYSPQDFMPKPPKQPLSAEALRAKFKMMG